MSHVSPLSHATLRRLVPVQLVSYRTDRYHGDGISVSIADFAPADQHTIKQLYGVLQALVQVVANGTEHPEKTTHALQRYLSQSDWNDVIQSVQQLGADPLDQPMKPLLAEAIHDIRGGALTALVMLLRFIQLGIFTHDELPRVIFLIHDHKDMMRNTVYDLDTTQYIRDRQSDGHSIFRLVERWNQVVYTLPHSKAHILLDCSFAGNITASRIEFAGLNRAMYNLINNAVKYTTDEKVHVSIFGVPGQSSQEVRFVIYNGISPAHRRTLQHHYGTHLETLFQGGFTTGGVGLGMRICAEHVALDYGLQTVEQCIQKQYVGAMYQDGYFIVWFHWPAASANDHETTPTIANMQREHGSNSTLQGDRATAPDPLPPLPRLGEGESP